LWAHRRRFPACGGTTDPINDDAYAVVSGADDVRGVIDWVAALILHRGGYGGLPD